jgi:glutamine amidotransferase
MSEIVTIVDYGSGNLASLKSAFEYIGCEVGFASTSEDVGTSDTLVLPGVGSFDNACKQLTVLGLVSAIREAVLVDRKKVLGICLGMQLFFDSSEEGKGQERGLQIFPQRVYKLKRVEDIVIPHTGFNKVSLVKDQSTGDERQGSRLLRGIDNPFFYFVHSYRVEVNAKLNGLKLMTCYGEPFLAGYEEENIFLTQFHPEKSQTNGLQLLQNFIRS